MTTLIAKELSLNDVHRLLGFQRQYKSSFASLLSLEPLTEFELQELVQIRDDFDNYLSESKVLEGMVLSFSDQDFLGRKHRSNQHYRWRYRNYRTIRYISSQQNDTHNNWYTILGFGDWM